MFRRFLLVRVQFELCDRVLQAGPFLRIEGHEFQAKLLCTTPPDHRLENFQWRLLFRSMDAQFQ